MKKTKQTPSSTIPAGFKLNTQRVKKLLARTDNPMLNDLIFTGVRQILGIEHGPIEFQTPTGVVTTPNYAMLEFLQDLEILATEKTKEELLHS